MSNRHINPDDLALFALQLLSPEEMTTIERELLHDEEARAQLAEVQGDLALLALSAAAEAPPVTSRDRLLLQISREPQRAAASSASVSTPAADPLTPTREPAIMPQSSHSETPRRNALLRGAPWLGWAAAAVLAVNTGRLAHQRDTLREDVADGNHQLAALDQQTARARRLLDTMQDPSAQHVTLTLMKQHPVPQGKATYNPDRGTLVFVANNLEPLQPQKTYELWVIPSNGTAPIPAGVFKPDQQGNASVLLPKLPVGVAAKAFGVTIENEGGSGAPTMPILLAGSPS